MLCLFMEKLFSDVGGLSLSLSLSLSQQDNASYHKIENGLGIVSGAQQRLWCVDLAFNFPRSKSNQEFVRYPFLRQPTSFGESNFVKK